MPESDLHRINTKPTPAHRIGSIVEWARLNPGLAGGALLAAGAGIALAGAPLVAAGAALAGFGITITHGASVIGLISVFLGVLGRDFRFVGGGLAVSMGGAVVGSVVTLIGAVIGAAGVFLTTVGWIILAAGLLLAVLRAGSALYRHRAAIVAIVHRIRAGAVRTPGAAALSTDAADRQKVDDLLRQVDHELARVDRFTQRPS